MERLRPAGWRVTAAALAIAAAAVWGAPAAAVQAAPAAAAAAKPALNAAAAARMAGVWMPEKIGDQLLSADGKPVPLKAAARRLYEDRIAMRRRGDTSFDRTTWCAAPGMPRILTMPYPFEIKPDRTLIGFIHGWYRWHRVVDLSGIPADPVLPITMGYPVGTWEGDVLVVRSTGFTSETILDAAGMPHSEEMSLVERIRLLPDGRLENRITIEDPETFERAWTTVLTFRRQPGAVVGDDVCPDRIRYGQPAVKGAEK